MEKVLLKLYVTGQTVRSQRAMRNLRRVCEEQLPDRYRQAVRLSEIEELPQKEIARQQGLSLSGAKSRVQRGRNMVKNLLTECCRFEFDHQRKMIDYDGKGQGCGSSCGQCGGR